MPRLQNERINNRGLCARRNAARSTRPRQPALSGSTPHEYATAIRQSCSSCPPLIDRPRRNTPRLSSVVADRPTFDRVRRRLPLIHRSRRRRAARCIGSNSIGQLACSPQIPIEPAAPVLPTMRGFLPWRLSDAGRRMCRAVNHAAGIRNSSQKLPQAASKAHFRSVS